MLELVLLCAALVGGGGGQDKCPDETVQKVPARTVHFYGMICGIPIAVEGGNPRRAEMCPEFSILTPAHWVPVKAPGSGTRAKLAGTLEVKAVTYECVEDRLLGIIPIVVSTRCVQDQVSTWGTVRTFTAVPCKRKRD